MRGKNKRLRFIPISFDMKTFQFKIKSYDNEEGEYSEWQQAESGTIIQLILNHWFNETLPNNLDVVVIKNSKGDQLVLDHERKDVFRYFFVPQKSGWSYYYKMTDITFMFFTLESFFNNLTEDLVNNMNKTMDDWRWVKGDFLQKNFHYKMRAWRLINHFTGLAIIVLVWFTLLILVILADTTTVRLVIGGIWILWSLFGFRLRNKNCLVHGPKKPGYRVKPWRSLYSRNRKWPEEIDS